MTIKSELDAYLRLDQIRCKHLFRILEPVSGLSVNECSLRQGAGQSCGFAGLTTDMGSLICLRMGQEMNLGACSVSAPLLLFASGGDVAISISGDTWAVLDVPVWVDSTSGFQLRFSEHSQLFIMKPSHQQSAVCMSSGAAYLPTMAILIKNYLADMKFYFDDTHAKDLTQELFWCLASLQAGGHVPIVRSGAPSDWRLLRAIEKIEENPSWEFNLQELASYSGASERNLYYLMKQNTGMTPYRFYQRQSLIRVRRRLVSGQASEPHISRCAADEGFSHLGRFAALYREHFGELPSKTIQCRHRLLGAEARELLCEELTQG